MIAHNSVPRDERSQQLHLLDEAETALRSVLHMHGVDANGRAHLERAMAHLHEAHIAINEEGKGRSVHQLVTDLGKVERLILSVKQKTGVTV